MPRRIELELTSERPDGTWTWRAAGAREPKGELTGELLPGGTKVGDVLRAEAEFHIDGITILSVLPPKGGRQEPDRIEVLGPQRDFTPVTSTLVGKGERRGPRRDRSDRPERGERGDRSDRGPRPRRDDRPRPDGPRAERPRRERPAPPPPKPKPKKLRAGRVHRDALLAGLSPEQLPIAEQLFRGGMPSVRQALAEQNAKAKAEGLPEMPTDTVLGIAESLLPQVRVADWLDRAEAAAANADEIALRDLRAVVSSADDVARDESTRELAARLKEVLERRTQAEQAEWLRDLTTSLDAGRVVRALRLSSRPPQPGEHLADELTTRLAEAAGGAMTSDIASDRWATLLDAVAYSPVRRTVVPAGAPAEPTDELLAMARKHAGRVPAAAKLFGIEPPPAPAGKGRRAPRPKPQPAKVSHPPLPPLPGGGRRIPPPPRATTAPPGEVPAAAAADSPAPHGDELPADAPVTQAPASTDPVTTDTKAPSTSDSPKPHGDELPAEPPVAQDDPSATAPEPPAEAPVAQEEASTAPARPAEVPSVQDDPSATAPAPPAEAEPAPGESTPPVQGDPSVTALAPAAGTAPAEPGPMVADVAEAIEAPVPTPAPELVDEPAADAGEDQLPVAEAPAPLPPA